MKSVPQILIFIYKQNRIARPDSITYPFMLANNTKSDEWHIIKVNQS